MRANRSDSLKTAALRLPKLGAPPIGLLAIVLLHGCATRAPEVVERPRAEVPATVREAPDVEIANADSNMQFERGFDLEMGRETLPDAYAARRWYRAAALQGHARAQHRLGFLHATGTGGPADFDEAVHWLRAAADQDLKAAQRDLGLLYAGREFPERRDLVEAYAWLSLAAEGASERARQTAEVMGVIAEELSVNEHEIALKRAAQYRAAMDPSS